MATMNEFTAKFWGVRGTLPIPGAATLRYGGNTSCVEVHCAGQTIILDAGSGLKLLGDGLTSKRADILLSHTHIDHIIGLPFFTPFYDVSRTFTLWAGHLAPDYTLRTILRQLMSSPLFPLTPDHFHATMHYRDFNAGEEIITDHWQQAGIRITSLPLAHPDRATGYRIACGGKSLCYITDYEHTPGQIEPALIAFVKNSDCLIYDSTYDDQEFASYKGWGHSTWQQAVRLADAAGVKTLVIFHHDPEANDERLDARAAALEKIRPASIIAREGLKIMI